VANQKQHRFLAVGVDLNLHVAPRGPFTLRVPQHFVRGDSDKQPPQRARVVDRELTVSSPAEERAEDRLDDVLRADAAC